MYLIKSVAGRIPQTAKVLVDLCAQEVTILVATKNGRSSSEPSTKLLHNDKRSFSAIARLFRWQTSYSGQAMSAGQDQRQTYLLLPARTVLLLLPAQKPALVLAATRVT